MIRTLFRLCLAGAALSVAAVTATTTVGVVRLAASNPTEAEIRNTLEAALAPVTSLLPTPRMPGPARPVPDTRATVTETLSTIETLYDQLASIYGDLETALSDPWEQRTARDRAALAHIAKKQALSAVQSRNPDSGDWREVETAARTATYHRNLVETELERAKAKLSAAQDLATKPAPAASAGRSR